MAELETYDRIERLRSGGRACSVSCSTSFLATRQRTRSLHSSGVVIGHVRYLIGSTSNAPVFKSGGRY
jgi:hypothetical protein